MRLQHSVESLHDRPTSDFCPTVLRRSDIRCPKILPGSTVRIQNDSGSPKRPAGPAVLGLARTRLHGVGRAHASPETTRFLYASRRRAVAWPLAARAQQPTKKIRSLGLLLPGLPEASMGKATRDRLRELGYAEGRDILLQARWANGNMERLDELAVELAHLQLDAIIAYTTPGL